MMMMPALRERKTVVLALFVTLLVIALSTTVRPRSLTGKPPRVGQAIKVPKLVLDVTRPAAKEMAHDGAARGAYAVQPILFVPADVQPHPYGLAFIDRQMQNLQHWFAEQLDGRTFTLKPAQLVPGQKARATYFEPCYPPVHDEVCSWGRSSWRRVFQELEQQGFPWSENLILGVFFQGEGIGTALGGDGRFLVDMGVAEIFPDCQESGCDFNISLGGTAHELGHALGIPWHPQEREHATYALMSAGLYRFPKCAFINSRRYPERDLLRDSPFINHSLALSNPGFEDCLAGWLVSAGTPKCKENIGHSGTRNLWLSGQGPHLISQSFGIDPKQIYDISGWLRARTVPGGGRIAVILSAFDAAGQVTQTITLADVRQRSEHWERFAASVQLPEGTEKAVMRIETVGTGVAAELDDFTVSVAGMPPPVPLRSGTDSVSGGDNLILSWSPLYSATSFEIQVASDPFFNDILLAGSTCAFKYLVGKPLPHNAYTFWRVRALNGAGASDWSPPWSIGRPISGELFSEEFVGPVLSHDWTNVSLAPASWHVGDFLGHNAGGYLVLGGQSGADTHADKARNLLLRDAPQGDFALETLLYHSEEFCTGHKQHGVIVMQDEANSIQLAYEWRNGWRLTFAAYRQGALEQKTSLPLVDPVRIKIERRGLRYAAFFSANGVTWRKLGSDIYANWQDPRAGLFSYVEGTAAEASFVAFDWIRVTVPCPFVAIAPVPPHAGRIEVEGAACGHAGQFREGTPLRLTAEPKPGYRFSHWSGAASGRDNPLVVQATHNLTIHAHFSTKDLQGLQTEMPSSSRIASSVGQ